MDRLQADRRLSDDNLAQLETVLRKNRQLQIRRLKEYAQAGKFPKNTGFSLARPIFVDASNTACAVGHLMRESGAHAIVENVRASNNFVRVLDLEYGSVTDWILQSGLTQEEAALIQPTYPLIHGEDCTVIAGPSRSFNGGIGGEFVLNVVNPDFTVDLGFVATGVTRITAVSQSGDERNIFPDGISDATLLGSASPPIRLTGHTFLIEGLDSSFGPNGITSDDWQTAVTGLNGIAQTCIHVPTDLPNLDFEEGSTRWFSGNIDVRLFPASDRLTGFPNQIPPIEIESLGEATIGAVSLLSGSEAIEGQSAVLRGALNEPAALMREHPSSARFVEFEYRGDRPTLVEHTNSVFEIEYFLPADSPLFDNALELTEIEPGRLRAEISRGGLLGFHALEGETVIIDNVVFSVPEPKFSNVVVPTLGILFLTWGRRKRLRTRRKREPRLHA